MGNVIKVDFKPKKVEKAHVMTVVDDRRDIKPVNWQKVGLYMIIVWIVAALAWRLL